MQHERGRWQLAGSGGKGGVESEVIAAVCAVSEASTSCDDVCVYGRMARCGTDHASCQQYELATRLSPHLPLSLAVSVHAAASPTEKTMEKIAHTPCCATATAARNVLVLHLELFL